MFLLMLAIVTFALNSVSFFFVRLLPPHSTTSAQMGDGQSDSQVLRSSKSHDGYSQHAISGGKSTEASSSRDEYGGPAEDLNVETHETSSLLSKSSDSSPEEYGFGRRTAKDFQSEEADIRGLALLARSEFWQLFLVFGLLTGIGLMNIK